MNSIATPCGSAADARRWGAGWHGWRNWLVSEARFRRFIARTPLLRGIARRQAAALFDLCAGFVNAQVLHASVRLGLLESLRAGALRRDDLQRRCGLEEAPLRLLLGATDALKLTETRGAECWGLGMLGAALLGNAAVLRMIEHQPLMYDDLRDPIALLQGRAAPGELARYWAYARKALPQHLDEAAVDSYTNLMSATQSLVAEDLLDAYPFRQHHCVLDVGGGDGTFLGALGLRWPRLKLMLFDLPALVERARSRLGAAGLASRAQVYGGDFTSTALPLGADVISLVRVLHDHEDARVRKLLQSVRRALPNGGRVVIAEPMRGVPRSLPVAERYLGFYLLAMGQGRMRSADELIGFLGAAGFVDARQHATRQPWQCAVVSAQA
ncbi:MAG: methyltransferase [Steroidobacteraceae bacterium]